jgi:integrase
VSPLLTAKQTSSVYGRLTLHHARNTAQRIFTARLDGRDPASEKLESRRREVVDRVDDLVRAYAEQHLSKIRSGHDARLRLLREVVPRWGARSIHDIKRRDVGELTIAVAGERTPYAGHKLLKTLKPFFTWCMGRGVLESSPAIGVRSGYQDVARDRVLDDDELARVLRAARSMRGTYGNVIEFLVLTGQRREEVNRLTWDEIDLEKRTWTLPASRAKNGRRHIIHLSAEALDVLERQPRISTYVFSDTERPFQRFGHAKPRLDMLSGVSNWVLHDLRRTCVSGIARLGYRPISRIRSSTINPARFPA